MSFYYAVRGIVDAIRSERNLRFHLVIANLIAVFAYFYGISRLEWMMLLTCIALVIAAELINTAIERTVDTATKEIKPEARIAKDAAAGAVLVLAVLSAIIGFYIFGNTERISRTLIHIFTMPQILIPCLVLGILDILFLIFGGKHEK